MTKAIVTQLNNFLHFLQLHDSVSATFLVSTYTNARHDYMICYGSGHL